MREFYHVKISMVSFILTVLITYLVPDRKSAVNTYIILVVIPVITMLSWDFVKGIITNTSMRWFAILSLYCLTSMLWGPSADQIDNHLLRILGLWAFLFLLYGLARYHPDFFVGLDKVMIGCGAIWVLTLLINWESLWQSGGPEFDLSQIPYGVFTHHVQIGWMLAALSLLSLQRATRHAEAYFYWLGCGLFFFAVLICSQARGGYLVFGAGLVAWVFMGSHLKKWKYLLTAVVALSGILLVVFMAVPGMFRSIWLRGSASRYEIWANWYDLWTSNACKAFFGYGLNHPTENFFGKHVIAHFHNFYLNSLFYVGIVGLVLIGGWIVCAIRTYADGKSICPQWYPVVIGMLAGFMTDGDKIFNYPGAFVFCFILPVFCLSVGKGMLAGSVGGLESEK